MRSKILNVSFAVSLVDEDDDGNVVNVVTLGSVTAPGEAAARELFEKHLADVHALIAERERTLSDEQPQTAAEQLAAPPAAPVG